MWHTRTVTVCWYLNRARTQEHHNQTLIPCCVGPTGQSHRSGNRLHPGNVSSPLLQRWRGEDGGRSGGSVSSSWLRLQERIMENGAPPPWRPVNETDWSNCEPSCRSRRIFINTLCTWFSLMASLCWKFSVILNSWGTRAWRESSAIPAAFLFHFTQLFLLLFLEICQHWGHSFSISYWIEFIIISSADGASRWTIAKKRQKSWSRFVFSLAFANQVSLFHLSFVQIVKFSVIVTYSTNVANELFFKWNSHWAKRLNVFNVFFEDVNKMTVAVVYKTSGVISTKEKKYIYSTFKDDVKHKPEHVLSSLTWRLGKRGRGKIVWLLSLNIIFPYLHVHGDLIQK